MALIAALRERTSLSSAATTFALSVVDFSNVFHIEARRRRSTDQLVQVVVGRADVQKDFRE